MNNSKLSLVRAWKCCAVAVCNCLRFFESCLFQKSITKICGITLTVICIASVQVQAKSMSMFGLSGSGGSGGFSSLGFMINGDSFASQPFANESGFITATGSSSFYIATAKAYDSATHKAFFEKIDSVQNKVFLIAVDSQTGEITTVNNSMNNEVELQNPFSAMCYDPEDKILVGPQGFSNVSFNFVDIYGFRFTCTKIGTYNVDTGEELNLLTETNSYIATTFAYDSSNNLLYAQKITSSGVILFSINTKTGEQEDITLLQIPFRTMNYDSETDSLIGLMGYNTTAGMVAQGMIVGGTGFYRFDLKNKQLDLIANCSDSYSFIAATVSFDSTTHKLYLQRVEGDGSVSLVSLDTVIGGELAVITTVIHPLYISIMDDSSGETPAAAVNTKDEGPPNCALGNPINIGTGNKFQEEKDYQGAEHTGLELTRYYNSQGNGQSGFGERWTSTWHRLFAYDDTANNEQVYISRAEGKTYSFTKNDSGAWESGPDDLVQLSGSDSTGWALVLPDDSTERYSPEGQLQTITTRAGRVTSLTYDAQGNLTTVKGPFGHQLHFAYGDAGYISQVTVPDGDVYTYAHDSNGNLISVTYPDGAKRQYLYENTTYPDALTGIIDANGSRFATYTYDVQGRVIETKHAGDADITSVTYGENEASVTLPSGGQRDISFATVFGQVKPTTVDNSSCNCGARAYEYDPATGLLASRTDNNGSLTTYIRNERGL
jgi:YD repeat-containing protein